MKTEAARDVFMLGRIAAGDAEAFRDLFDRRAPAVLGFLVGILKDRGVAEKALEEVFQEVWELAERFPAGEESPLRWMLVLARTRAAATLRTVGEQRAPLGRAIRAGVRSAVSSL